MAVQVDENGALYFTMKRIRGDSLAKVLDGLSGGDDETVVIRARQLGHGPSLASDQGSCGVVPHLDVPFEVAIGAAGTDPTQLEGCLPEAADVARRR